MVFSGCSDKVGSTIGGVGSRSGQAIGRKSAGQTLSGQILLNNAQVPRFYDGSQVSEQTGRNTA